MRWTIKPKPNAAEIEHLAKELSINETLATILVQRNIKTFEQAKQFFRPSLNDLHDPYLMKDMDRAVNRIEKAIINNENILIYGDYDVDGTTAVSLLYSYLTTFYKNISSYIPDRYDEGYGISYQGIDFAGDNNFSLIIALDCGIKAIEKVAYATKKGIDFIICDHHKPGVQIPKAIAVLNPKRLDCEYPFKELCGCGVGFKLIQALGLNRNQTVEDLKPYLDLVATATGADIVPITGENRILAYHGLQIINSNTVRNGFKAIMKELKKTVFTITDVVFTIAPRINAAGRIKHGNYAVELLTEMDLNLATKVAQEIEAFNSYRRELDASITEEALQQIQNNFETQNYTSVVYDENWHKGVIGIVASRLIETYYRPTLVFTKSGDKLAASARSVRGFDVYEALDKCSEFIEQFGGHKYAAGLTLLPENFLKFKQKFEQVVKESITEEQRSPELLIDANLNINDITPKFYRILKQMAPFGPHNMRPVFASSNIQDTGYAKCVGADQKHLKFCVFEDNDRSSYNAIGFNLGNKIERMTSLFDMAYNIDENHWNGTTSLQLLVKDID